MSEVGLIGIGLVGRVLASRLLAAGYRVYGYDPVEEARQRLVGLGGRAAESAPDVARECRRVFLSLPGPGEVREVVDAISPELRRGDIVIDTTTGEAEGVEAIAEELAVRGVEYLDATLGGSSKQIEAGEALVICGASDKAFEALWDLLRTISGNVFHMGATGTGTRMKLVLNLAIGLHRAVLAEALEFARKSGIHRERALEVLKAGPAYSTAMAVKGKKMLTGDFHPEARLAQHWKDVKLILSSGAANGAKLPLSTLHEQLLHEAYDAGWGLEDNSAIIKVFQDRNS